MSLPTIPGASRCEQCGGLASLTEDLDFYFLQCEDNPRHLEMLNPVEDEGRSDRLEPEWFMIGAFHAEACARASGGTADEERWRREMRAWAEEDGLPLDFAELVTIWRSKQVRFVLRSVEREYRERGDRAER